MEIIDLHTHTTASDGSLTPSELVAAARAAGLKAVAVTDHDTVEGLAEALEAGARLGMRVVPGVEISVNGGPRGSMHVLGLFVEHENPQLIEGLKTLQEARARRNPQIVAKLNALGIPLTLEEVAALAGGRLVGRPHFAQALMARGVVKDRGEAFGRFLAAGAKAYVAKWRFEPAQGMDLLRRAGAVPILAHPGLLKVGLAEIEVLARDLMAMGMEGIEALYSEHDPAFSQALARLAARLGLVVSGGSDFHGRAKPDISLGLGRGGLRVPAAWLKSLEQRRDRVRARLAGGPSGH